MSEEKSNLIKIDTINKIAALEKEMAGRPQEHIKIEPLHHFSKGLYAREILIPAGTILTGKIHKYECLNVVSKGKISVASIDGIQIIDATDGPVTFKSSPGVKRLGYAHSDTVWMTIHASEETDLEKLEDELIAKDYSEVDSISEDDLKLLKGINEGE